MKSFYFFTLMLSLSFGATAQTTDTCTYVSDNNDIGGLDCYVGSLAPYTPDTYQWLNCDNNYAPIIGQTTQEYTGMSSINVSFEVSYAGCVDTSDCLFVCTWGIEELLSDKVELVQVLDAMGRKTKDEANKLMIFVYSDGTTEKVFRVE